MTPTAEIKAQDIVVEHKKNSLTELKGKLDRETLGALAEKLEQKLDAFDKNIQTKISDSCTNLLDDKTKTLTDTQRIALNKVKEFLKPKTETGTKGQINIEKPIDPSKSPMLETRTKEQINTIKTKAPTDKFLVVEGGKPDRQYKKSEDGKTLYAKDKEGKNFQKYNEDSHTRTFLADFQIQDKGTTEKYNINRQEIKEALTSVTNSPITQESKDLIISALNKPNKENITSLQTFLKENISDTDRVATNERFLKDGKFGPKTKDALTKYLTEESATENKKLEATTKKSNETSIDLTTVKDIELPADIKGKLDTIKLDQQNVDKLDGLVKRLNIAEQKISNPNASTEIGKEDIKKQGENEKTKIKEEIRAINANYEANPAASLKTLKTKVNNDIDQVKISLGKVLTESTTIQGQLNIEKTAIEKDLINPDISETTQKINKENQIKNKESLEKISTKITAITTLLGDKNLKGYSDIAEEQSKEKQKLEAEIKEKEANVITPDKIVPTLQKLRAFKEGSDASYELENFNKLKTRYDEVVKKITETTTNINNINTKITNNDKLVGSSLYEDPQELGKEKSKLEKTLKKLEKDEIRFGKRLAESSKIVLSYLDQDKQQNEANATMFSNEVNQIYKDIDAYNKADPDTKKIFDESAKKGNQKDFLTRQTQKMETVNKNIQTLKKQEEPFIALTESIGKYTRIDIPQINEPEINLANNKTETQEKGIKEGIVNISNTEALNSVKNNLLSGYTIVGSQTIDSYFKPTKKYIYTESIKDSEVNGSVNNNKNINNIATKNNMTWNTNKVDFYKKTQDGKTSTISFYEAKDKNNA